MACVGLAAYRRVALVLRARPREAAEARMRVIAIDPGKLCGWVAADVDDTGEWGNLEHGILPAKELILRLYSDQTHGGPHGVGAKYDVIVYEDWVLYRKHAEEYIGSDMPYSQIIGQIRMIGWLSNTRVVKQGAAAKTNARKQLAAYWPTISTLQQSIEARAHKDAHDGDAILHLWAWTVKHYYVRKHDS
jgi:hypothetical protein